MPCHFAFVPPARFPVSAGLASCPTRACADTRTRTRCSASPAPPRRTVLASILSTGLLLAIGTPAANADATVEHTDAEWRLLLAPDAYRVMRQDGTERPFSSALNGEKRDGMFACAGCGLELFSSSVKFDSGTGWPSFFDVEKGAVRLVETRRDRLLLQKECRCAKCDGHLGHVFRDGPRPTGLRYCINGLALKFKPAAQAAQHDEQCDAPSHA